MNKKGNSTKELLALIRGTHCMSGGGLADYYAAKGAINAMRSDNPLAGVRHHLKNYRVSVFGTPDGIRVINTEVGKELILRARGPRA